MKTRLNIQKDDDSPSKKSKLEHHSTIKIKDLYEDFFSVAMSHAIGAQDASQVIVNLSKTSQSIFTLFQQPSVNLDHVLLRALYQAVIDDSRQLVSDILKLRPNLLLMKCPKDLIIQSQLTWQKFCIDEDLLTVAVLRKQLEMIKLLDFYYDKLPQTEELVTARKNALSRWTPYTKFNAYGEHDIVPRGYNDLAKLLIHVFNDETFIDGKLSEKTEAAVKRLFNTLLPETAIKLDKYLDVELLLLAVYQQCGGYEITNGLLLRNKKQQDHFGIRVVGLILSVLSPEIANIFCHSLTDALKTIQDGKEPVFAADPKALRLMWNHQSFYRSAADSFSGLGFDFLCGTNGSKEPCNSVDWLAYDKLKTILLYRSTKFFEHRAAQANTAEQTRLIPG